MKETYDSSQQQRNEFDSVGSSSADSGEELLVLEGKRSDGLDLVLSRRNVVPRGA